MATVKVPVACPLPNIMVQPGLATTLPVSEHAPVSSKLKLTPSILTVVPTGPEVGFSVSVGAATVSVAVAESPLGVPVTVTVYVPVGTEPTKNCPLMAPLPTAGTVHVGVAMSEPPPVIVQAVSAAENPTPLTAIVAPTPPNVGFRVIEGLTTTVNAADAASPPEPVTVIV